MNVPGELHRSFKAACGAASMTQVTAKLWQYFLLLDNEERYAIIRAAGDTE